MDKITQSLKHLLSKKTALGRTVRTLLQAIIGISGLVLAAAALPGLLDFMNQSFPNTVGTISLAVTVATAVWNAAEKLLVALNGWSE